MGPSRFPVDRTSIPITPVTPQSDAPLQPSPSISHQKEVAPEITTSDALQKKKTLTEQAQKLQDRLLRETEQPVTSKKVTYPPPTTGSEKSENPLKKTRTIVEEKISPPTFKNSAPSPPSTKQGLLPTPYMAPPNLYNRQPYNNHPAPILNAALFSRIPANPQTSPAQTSIQSQNQLKPPPAPKAVAYNDAQGNEWVQKFPQQYSVDRLGIAQDLRSETLENAATKHLTAKLLSFRELCAYFNQPEAKATYSAVRIKNNIQAKHYFTPTTINERVGNLNRKYEQAHISIIPRMNVVIAQTNSIQDLPDEIMYQRLNATNHVDAVINRIDDEIEKKG